MAESTDLSLWNALPDGCKTDAIQRALPTERLRRTELLLELDIDALVEENTSRRDALDFLTEIKYRRALVARRDPDNTLVPTITATEKKETDDPGADGGSGLRLKQLERNFEEMNQKLRKRDVANLEHSQRHWETISALYSSATQLSVSDVLRFCGVFILEKEE